MPLLQGTEIKYGIGRIGFMPLLQGAEVKYGIGRIGFMPLLQDTEVKYGILFEMFFFSPVWLVQFLRGKQKQNNYKFEFSWLALLFKHFFIKIQPNMSEQEKKQLRIYDLLNAQTKPNPKKFPK